MGDFLEREKVKEFLKSHAQLTVYNMTVKYCVPISLIDEIPSTNPFKKTCKSCGSENYYAKGLCKRCYYRGRYKKTSEHKKPKGRPARKEPSDTDRAILDAVREANSQSEVAREFGVTRQRVHYITKRWPEYTGGKL